MLKTVGDKQTPVISPKLDMDQFVEGHSYLCEGFRNWKCEEIGISKPMNILESVDGLDDPILSTKVAIYANNFCRQAMKLQETSRADLPKWIKNGLALISTSYADDLTNQIISEQPLPSKSGKIHYMDIQTESSKGRHGSGMRVFDALRGFGGTDDITDEKIVEEPIGASGSATYTVNIEYLPIIPGSFKITDGTQVVQDDGNGNLVGDVEGTPGGGITQTINYITGALSLQFDNVSTGAVSADYSYNIEAATALPKYGISLRSVTVEARPRAIATEWSQQAVFDLMNDWGVDAEPTILDAGAKIIYAEKFKHVTNHLYRVANGGTLVFDNTNPTGINYREHIDSFGIMLSRLQHEIWANTQRVRPNVCILSPDIWFLFQYTRGFKGEGAPSQTDSLAGPKVIGTLTNHNLLCICDPTFKSGSAVLTYRGNEMVNTAAILGMYIPLYKAPIHAQGFRKDTALLTEYVIHPVNTQMMGTIEVINL